MLPTSHCALLCALVLLALSQVGECRKKKLTKAKVKDVSHGTELKEKLAGMANQLRKGSKKSSDDGYGNTLGTVIKYDNMNLVRTQQYFKGLKVFGAHVVDIYNKTGTFVDNLEEEFPTVDMDELNRAVTVAQQKLRAECENMRIGEVSGEPIVYVDEETGEGTLAVHVSMWCYENGQVVKIPNAIYDDEGSLLLHWNDVKTGFERTGTGPGGNKLIGQYSYGTGNLKEFTVYNLDGKCYMHSQDVTTYWCTGQQVCPVHNFTCGTQQAADKVNGGYSPLNDVHAGAQSTLERFQEWYGHVPFPPEVLPLKMLVHLGESYDNAVYLGGTLFGFGDGDGVKTYPFTTIDIVAHEIGHAVNAFNAQLCCYNTTPGGGLDESFSDITGLVVSTFLGFPNNWTIGMVNVNERPLRYMNKPSLDGRSIEHITHYEFGMNPHLSSGIFNKAGEGLLKTLKILQNGLLNKWDYTWINPDHVTLSLEEVGIFCNMDTNSEWICRK